MVRLKKMRLDELRKELSQIEDRRDAVRAESRAFEVKIREEQKLVTDQAQLMEYGRFAGVVIEHRRVLEGQIQVITIDVVAKKDEVQAAFEELKQFELIQKTREARERRERERKEQIAMDDLALDMHRRRQE